MENFVLYDEIGAGNDRTVYKGRRKGTIEYVSIHCIGKTKRKHIQNNVRICHELNHKNCVRFYEWYETSNHLWLVVELCTGPSLETILVQDLVLPETTIRSFGGHIVQGLVYLHSLDIIYVDLCPKKILLDGDSVLKFGNFSLAKFEGEGDFSEHFHKNFTNGGGGMGSSLYMAPEVLSGNRASKESDLWQLGCVLYEMYTGSPPFKAERFEDLCQKIKEAKYEYPVQIVNEEVANASENLSSLIKGLLRVDPSKRLTLHEVCIHPFWQDKLDDVASTLIGNQVSDASILCDSFSYANKTNQNTNEVSIIDSLQDVTQNGTKRPDTVPQEHESRTLQTKSLTDERPALKNVKNTDDVKEKWKGTYKLEQGLAIMDLTEIGVVDDQIIEDDQTMYSKSRESKSPFNQNKFDTLQKNSINSTSATVPLTNELIWNLKDYDTNVNDYLYHASDLHVNPISENPKLLKLHVLKWDPTLLGFHALNMEKLRNNTKDEVRTHVGTVFNAYTQIQKSSQDKGGTRQKMHILAYLCTICKHEEVSNVILEQQHVKHLISEFKTAQTDIKVRLGRVIGVVASNTTYIPLSFNMSELFTVLTDQLKQNFRNTVLKHSLLPAIGELLFFAATQEENEKTEIEQWEPSSAVFTIITRCLHQEDDHIARHIAAKIIENVIVTQGRYCKKFLTNEVGLGLWNLLIHAAADTEKVTAASTLCRMSMHLSTVLQHVSDRAGFNTFQQCVVSGPQKCQQSFVTIFVCLLSSNNHAKRILQETSLIKKLMNNLESAPFILRGKVYLLVAEMCKRSHNTLLQCCELRLIAHLEKDGRRLLVGGKENKEVLNYLQQCLCVLLKCIVHLLSPIFESILHILDVVTGRHHPNVAQTKQLKLLLPLLSVPVHLVTSSLFRKTVVDSKFVQYVGKLLVQIRRIDNGDINLSGNLPLAEQATSNIFSIIEAMAQIPSILFQNFFDIVSTVLPVLASFSQSANGNLRILSMKLFVDISTLFLDNEAPEATFSQDRDSEALLSVIEQNFLPDFESLLQDHEPLPSYCLKLLYSFTEKSPKIIEQLVERNILTTLIDIMQTSSDDGTVLLSTVGQNTVGILNNIVACKHINFLNIYQPVLIDYLTSTFIEVMEVINEDSNTNSLSSLLLPLLDTLHHVLKSIEALVRTVKDKENGAEEYKDELSQQIEDLHRESEVLSDLDGTLINLLPFDDPDIQEWACRCLHLSAELYGGDVGGFSEENVETFCHALRESTFKRQKDLLKIVRLLVVSNESLVNIFKNSSSSLISTLEKLSDNASSDSDGKKVKNVSQELLKLLT